MLSVEKQSSSIEGSKKSSKVSSVVVIETKTGEMKTSAIKSDVKKSVSSSTISVNEPNGGKRGKEKKANSATTKVTKKTPEELKEKGYLADVSGNVSYVTEERKQESQTADRKASSQELIDAESGSQVRMVGSKIIKDSHKSTKQVSKSSSEVFKSSNQSSEHVSESSKINNQSENGASVGGGSLITTEKSTGNSGTVIQKTASQKEISQSSSTQVSKKETSISSEKVRASSFSKSTKTRKEGNKVITEVTETSPDGTTVTTITTIVDGQPIKTERHILSPKQIQQGSSSTHTETKLVGGKIVHLAAQETNVVGDNAVTSDELHRTRIVGSKLIVGDEHLSSSGKMSTSTSETVSSSQQQQHVNESSLRNSSTSEVSSQERTTNQGDQSAIFIANEQGRGSSDTTLKANLSQGDKSGINQSDESHRTRIVGSKLIVGDEHLSSSGKMSTTISNTISSSQQQQQVHESSLKSSTTSDTVSQAQTTSKEGQSAAFIQTGTSVSSSNANISEGIAEKSAVKQTDDHNRTRIVGSKLIVGDEHLSSNTNQQSSLKNSSTSEASNQGRTTNDGDQSAMFIAREQGRDAFGTKQNVSQGTSSKSAAKQTDDSHRTRIVGSKLIVGDQHVSSGNVSTTKSNTISSKHQQDGSETFSKNSSTSEIVHQEQSTFSHIDQGRSTSDISQGTASKPAVRQSEDSQRTRIVGSKLIVGEEQFNSGQTSSTTKSTNQQQQQHSTESTIKNSSTSETSKQGQTTQKVKQVDRNEGRDASDNTQVSKSTKQTDDSQRTRIVGSKLIIGDEDHSSSRNVSFTSSSSSSQQQHVTESRKSFSSEGRTLGGGADQSVTFFENNSDNVTNKPRNKNHQKENKTMDKSEDQSQRTRIVGSKLIIGDDYVNMSTTATSSHGNESSVEQADKTNNLSTTKGTNKNQIARHSGADQSVTLVGGKIVTKQESSSFSTSHSSSVASETRIISESSVRGSTKPNENLTTYTVEHPSDGLEKGHTETVVMPGQGLERASSVTMVGGKIVRKEHKASSQTFVSSQTVQETKSSTEKRSSTSHTSKTGTEVIKSGKMIESSDSTGNESIVKSSKSNVGRDVSILDSSPEQRPDTSSSVTLVGGKIVKKQRSSQEQKNLSVSSSTTIVTDSSVSKEQRSELHQSSSSTKISSDQSKKTEKKTTPKGPVKEQCICEICTCG